jgi:DNA polymerase-3 subunit delta
MEPAAAQTMIEWCGRDMFLLHHEMEKLISYVEPEQPITAEDVRAIGTRQLKDTIFQLTSAMAVRSGPDAFAAYRELLRLETKPGQILYMLRREFKLIWLTKALRDQGESDREIARIAKIHPAFVGRYIKAQTAFTEEQLRQITEELADIQARIHTGRAKDREALEIFMTEHTGE